MLTRLTFQSCLNHLALLEDSVSLSSTSRGSLPSQGPVSMSAVLARVQMIEDGGASANILPPLPRLVPVVSWACARCHRSFCRNAKHWVTTCSPPLGSMVGWGRSESIVMMPCHEDERRARGAPLPTAQFEYPPEGDACKFCLRVYRDTRQPLCSRIDILRSTSCSDTCLLAMQRI